MALSYRPDDVVLGMILPFLVADVFHARAALRTEVSQAVARRPFLAAVEVKIDPHWHIYWRNPGDSGIPTTVDWKAPAGWKIEPLEYSVPKRFAPGGITAYGYENRVFFLAKVTPSARGGSLSAKVKWLVCRDACIPGAANLSLPLSIGHRRVKSPMAKLLESEAERLPGGLKGQASAWAGKQVGLKIEFHSRVLLTKSDLAEFFPLESGVVDQGRALLATPKGFELVFNMEHSPFPERRSHLKGLVVLTNGSKRYGQRVDAVLEKGEQP